MARLEDLPYELWLIIMKGLDPLSTIHSAQVCPRGYAVLCGLPQKQRYDEIALKIGHKNMGLIQAQDACEDTVGRSFKYTGKETRDERDERDEGIQLALSQLRSCIAGGVPRHGKGWLLAYLEDSKKVDNFNATITGCNSFIKLVYRRLLALGKQSVPSALRKRFLVALVVLRSLNVAQCELMAQLTEEFGIWACEGFKYLVYAYPSRQAALTQLFRFMGLRYGHLTSEEYCLPCSSLMNGAGEPAMDAN